MAFSSFTGNSKRPRNVNLSGNRSSPWSSSPTGSSNAISAAKINREQRQLDRKRLNAAKTVQRVWRRHRVRRIVRDEKRKDFDELYRPPRLQDDTPVRLQRGLPMLLRFFNVKLPQDVERLLVFTLDADTPSFQTVRFVLWQLTELVDVFTTLLDHASLKLYVPPVALTGYKA